MRHSELKISPRGRLKFLSFRRKERTGSMKFVRVCLFSVAVLNSARSAQSDLLQVSGSLSGQAFNTNVGSKNMTCNVASCADSQIDFNQAAHLALALDGSATAGDSSATAHAVANATIGKIGVGVLGAAVGSQGGTADASATNISASWSTTMVFKSPSKPLGAAMKVYASLLLDGDLSANATGKGSAADTLKIFDISTFPGLPPAPYANNGWGNRIVAPSSNPPLDILEEIPGGIRIRQAWHNGDTDSIGYRLVLTGGASSDQFKNNNAGGGVFSADVSNSLRWGGIEKVTDEFDNPIDDWTVTSESGFDFSKPFGVPEPASVLLLLSGILAICARGCQKRHKLINV
jgi:hypothetical protein